MGIERFFSAINKNFKVVDVFHNIKCDTFLIDFNSIIHNISSQLIKTLINNDNYSNYKIDDIDEIILIEIKKYLLGLLESIECKLIYIAIDGVPTFSKILEQKERRFIGDFVDMLLTNHSVPYSFSKSLISPGSKFMKKLVNFLNKIDFPVKTIISDYNEDGEGEFKIFDYIIEKNITDFVIYSPDADLIILCMIIRALQYEKDIKVNILRFDQNTQILNIIYINKLIDYFNFYYEDKVNKKIDFKRYILDLTFIFTIFGNDFLPRLEEINIGIDLYFVLDSYIINYVDNDYLLNENLDIVPKSFHNYFSFLAKYETLLLKRNIGLYKYQNFNYATQINLLLDIKNKKYNPNMIFYLDLSPQNTTSKYGKLEYYFYNNNQIIKALSNLRFKNNFNQKIEDAKRYQKFLPITYNSKEKKHVMNMKDMSKREREFYMIEKKLDNYYQIFNPTNKFFDTLNKKDYYEKLEPKQMVQDYLKGFQWLINYYFKRKNVDEFWYYKFHKSPLLRDIINYFNPVCLNYRFTEKKLNLKPIELLLYITPIKYNKIKEFLNVIDIPENLKPKINNFIEANMNLFYNLDEIYYSVLKGNLKDGLFDCSSSNFLSKCHYFILDDVKNIAQFSIL